MLDLIHCPQPDCDAPADVVDRFVLDSTDGPIEHIRTSCVHGHWFLLPTAWSSTVVAGTSGNWLARTR
jgi:hypothetical protein